MDKHLLSAFASDDPARFAQLLGDSSDWAEAIAILADIPDHREGDVVARLTPEAAGRILNELTDTVVAGWLSDCSADTARRLLARVGRERSAQLISGIESRSKRRELRRLVGYPPGSVGELMQVDVMMIRDSTRVADVRTEIQRQPGGPDALIVIVRDDGTVCGALDMVKFLKNADQDARCNDLRITVKPVFADAPQSSLKGREEWSLLTGLPVVDHLGRLIGAVSRSSIESNLASAGDSGLLLQSGIELSRQLLEFMVCVLLMIFDRRNTQ